VYRRLGGRREALNEERFISFSMQKKTKFINKVRIFGTSEKVPAVKTLVQFVSDRMPHAGTILL
jgi:hypothetical protein